MEAPPSPPALPIEPAPFGHCSSCYREHHPANLMTLTCQTNSEHKLNCCHSCVQSQSIMCPICAALRKVEVAMREEAKEENSVESGLATVEEEADKEETPNYCPNAGCSHWGSLSSHAEACMYRSVTCPAEGCDAKFPAVHQQQHVADCPFTMMQCGRGGQQCPPFARKDSVEHDRVCAQYGCRVTAGCQTRCTLPCLIQHEEGCRALMEAWRGAYDQHNEANAELARLRAENESLQRDKKVMKDAMMSWWQLAVKGAMAKKGWT